MNNTPIPAERIITRVGRLWSRLAGFAVDSGAVESSAQKQLASLETFIVKLGKLERGQKFSGLPSRWFVGPLLRFRCIQGHVHASSDAAKVVVGDCPVCSGPVTLTFPEDTSDPCEDGSHDYIVGRDQMRARLTAALGIRG